MLRFLRAAALPLLATATLALGSTSSSFAQFTQGNLVVVQPQGSSSAGQAVSLLEITPSGTLAHTYTVIPSGGASQLTISGSASSEGFWSLSAERDRIITVGYDAAAGTASVASTTTVNRLIGTVDDLGNFTRQYSQPVYSGNNIRSGTSYGANFMSGGTSPGIVLMNTATALSTAVSNVRCLQSINGNMYFSANSGALKGVYQLGAGISAATGQGVDSIAKDPSSNSAYGFAISPDGNTMYVASATSGILKFIRTTGSHYQFALASYTVYATACSGLAVDFSTANPTIYATLTTGLSLIKLVDAGSTVTSPTILYSTTSATPLRGVMFAPSRYGSVSGNAAICSGNSATVTFTGNPHGVITYNINGGTNQTITLDSAQGAATVGTGTLTSNATYNLVSITTPGGTKSLAGSITVSVNPLPAAIGGASTVCAGTMATLTDGTASGTWASNTAAVAAIGTNGALSAVSAGTTTISYTLPTGCYTTTVLTVIAAPAAIGGTLSVCEGNTTTLTNATSGGTWQSDAGTVASIGSSSGIVSGFAANTANITYTAFNGCTTQAVFTVNPLAAISGAAPVCVGATSTLTNTNTGGTWASDNTGVATIDATAGVVNGVANGTATISYTLSTGCTATAVVTVNPLPGSIGGTLELCAGSATALGNTGGGTWASSTVAVAAIGTGGIVSAASAGTTTITYTLPTGCFTTAIVTVDPLPAAISGPSAVCSGSVITLSDASAGGTWSSLSGNCHIADATAGIVSGNIVGSGTIKYTLSTGCYIMKSVTVNDVPAAISGTAVVCEGGTTTLSDGTTGGTWSSTATAIAAIGPVDGTLSGVAAGTSTVSYILPTGCYATTVATVNSLPGAISGTLQVCQGAITTLGNMITGGSWAETNGNAAVDAVNGVVSGVTAGTDAVTYTLGTGCYTTAVVTINSLPGTISGAAAICIGAAETLSSATTGGTWSSANTAKATIDASAGVITGVASGTAVVSYILGTGCYDTRVETINVLPAAITGAGTVCVGSNITLSDAATGGTWASADAPATVLVDGSTGAVTGVAAGVANITYTISTGCSIATAVTINELPAAIAGTGSVCAGNTLTLADATTGGTWLSGSGMATVDAVIGIVTGVSAGAATISYISGEGCVQSAGITVNALPAAISGTSALCAGASAVWTDAASGGTWASSDATTAAVGSSSGIVTAVNPGTATITYTLPTGCMATKAITINGAPAAITGTGAICAGNTLTLADAITGGTWSSTTTSIATVGSASGVVTGVANGTAVISYTAATGCATSTVVTVSATPSAITGATSVCAGSVASLFNTVGGGTWTSGNTTIATIGAATGTATGMAAGTVTISYALSSGCVVTATLTVNPLPASIAGSAVVCSGASSTLHDAISGGIWTSSNTAIVTVDAASGVLAGIAPGTAYITYTLPTGCRIFTAATVGVTPPAIAGTAVMCTGTTATLTNAIGSGSWSSSDTAIATIASASGIVNGLGAGTAGITYNYSGCIASVVVTVNLSPSAITGGTLVCLGAPLSLADAVAGGTWSSSNAGVATINSAGVVTGVAAGTTLVSYTLGGVCRTTAVLTINYAPAIPIITTHPGTPSCSGANYQNFGTNIAPAAGVTYEWTVDNASLLATGAGSQYCLVNLNTPGTATILLSATLGTTGCVRSDSVQVTVNTGVATFVSNIIYSGGELICTDNTYDTYQWGYDDAASLDSTIVPGATTQDYYVSTLDLLHKYYWLMTTKNGCRQKAYYNAPATIVNAPSLADVAVQLYPNPAASLINVKLEGAPAGTYTVLVYDMPGRLVAQQVFAGSNAAVSVDGLVPGTYSMVVLSEGQRIATRLFVKQ